METKKTIIETTKQVTTDNAIYDITMSKVNGVVNTITANVTAQIWKEDAQGGTILTASIGKIERDEKGNIKIGGEIPASILPDIVNEFNKIVKELYSNNVYEINSAY